MGPAGFFEISVIYDGVLYEESQGALVAPGLVAAAGLTVGARAARAAAGKFKFTQ
jgi:hypothetical protein